MGNNIQLWKLSKIKQAGVELGLTQAETVSLELGLIKGWTKTSQPYWFNSG